MIAQKLTAPVADRQIIAVQNTLFVTSINNEEVTVYDCIYEGSDAVYIAMLGDSYVMELKKTSVGAWSTTDGLQDRFIKAIGKKIDEYKN